MLPNSQHAPAQRSQRPIHCPVSLTIADEFLAPELTVGSRDGAVDWASMPEATIYEDDQLFLRKNKIRFANEGGSSAPPSDFFSSK